MRVTGIVSRMLWLLILAAVVYGSAIRLLRPETSEAIGKMEQKTARIVGKLALINAVIILATGGMDPGIQGENTLLVTGAEELLCSLLAGGLLAAACMDAKSSYVYNYVWWWCLLWTGMLLALPAAAPEAGTCAWKITDRFDIQQAAAVASFVFLQQFLFARMYGRADCHAFSVCALAGCIWKWDLPGFLIHMLLSVTLLAVVQFAGRNVTWNGKLRIPKPFIPYIVAAFWAELLITLYLQGGATHIYA